MAKIMTPETRGKMASGEAVEFVVAWYAGFSYAQALLTGAWFLGGYGYADRYYGGANSRNTMAWRGAFEGYMAGLDNHRGVVTDSAGNFLRFE